MADISISVNQDLMKELNDALSDYMKYSHRDIEEAINQHAYYIARNATQTTPAATKEQIEQDLREYSQINPNAPLAAILVNRDRAKTGKRGLYGERMAAAVETFIKKRQATRNFLRSGWIPAIKKLATVIKKKGGTKIPEGTAKKGRTYGGAKPALGSLTNWNMVCSIWNSVSPKRNSAKATAYIEKGAELAIEQEINSMYKYIERKQGEAIEKFFGG